MPLPLLLACFASSVAAQSRAALQVAAEVVQITPSSGALAQARDLAILTLPGRGATSLATIDVTPADSQPATAQPRRLARRVTIVFLSN